MENLLYGLMMVSGNDAAVALAEHIGGNIEGFAEMMNKKALDLGFSSTHFVTPHGLDQDEHYTTAFELAKLANYALKNPTFAKIVKTSSYTIMLNGNPKSLNNTNELLGYLDGVYGVKTGFTNGANRCLVSSCKRGNLDIICVVLGCDTKKDRTLDSINLINYTFNNFSIINIKKIINENFETWKSENAKKFFIDKGISSKVELSLKEEQIPYENLAINKKVINSINTPISYTSQFKAPLIANTVIGSMDVNIDTKNLFSIQIINNNTIEKKDSFYYLQDFVKNYFSYFST